MSTKSSPFRYVSDDTAPKNIYIDKDLMFQYIKDYQASIKSAEENNLPEPMMSEELGTYILELATGLSRRYNFRYYTFVSEMVSDAVILGLRLSKTFDVSHPSANPFSYFSFSMFRSFMSNIKYEKKQLAGKYDYVLQLDIDTSAYQEHDNDNDNNSQYVNYLREYVDEARSFKEKHTNETKSDENDVLIDELEIETIGADTIKRVLKASRYAELGF